jgi:hypothetical protein
MPIDRPATSAANNSAGPTREADLQDHLSRLRHIADGLGEIAKDISGSHYLRLNELRRDLERIIRDVGRRRYQPSVGKTARSRA